MTTEERILDQCSFAIHNGDIETAHKLLKKFYVTRRTEKHNDYARWLAQIIKENAAYPGNAIPEVNYHD